MSSFFNCAAYDDVDTTIRLDDHVVFLALKIKDKDSDMHITLNPFQTRILAKYLTVALTQIDFKSLADVVGTSWLQSQSHGHSSNLSGFGASHCSRARYH